MSIWATMAALVLPTPQHANTTGTPANSPSCTSTRAACSVFFAPSFSRKGVASVFVAQMTPRAIAYSSWAASASETNSTSGASFHLFEAIVVAALGLEHVDHEIAVVLQGPEAFLRAFDAVGLHARFFDLGFFDRVEHGVDLAVVLSGHG